MTTQPDTAVTGSPGKQKRQAFTTWSGVNIPVAPQFPEQIWLTEAVDDAVNKVYARMEKLFLDQKAENEAKEKAAEKALKSRLKKEKKERADERKELVDEIREMALELEDRDSEVEEPVVLKDAVGRRFIFPYEKCRTWRVSIPPPPPPSHQKHRN